MRQRIRFHLDEQIDPAIALGLRRHGIDVTTTVEAQLQGQTDSVQLEFAIKQQRVIVTHDADFLIIASQSDQHSGIAYCKQGTRSIGKIIQRLIQIYEQVIKRGRMQFAPTIILFPQW